MPNAIAYIRVSSEEQRDHGVSLDAQRGKIAAWAAFSGHTVVQVYEDAGISGKRADNRPALQEALRQVRKQRCPLVVYSLSRLSRSVRDTLAIVDALEKVGADLISLSEQLDTTTASGRMVFKMLTVLAEFEREQLAERTTVAMAHLRNLDRRISGRLPFGFTLAADGQHLVPDPIEQAGLALIASLRAAGLSYAAIAERLEAESIKPKLGKSWKPHSVRAIHLRAEMMKAA